ncbi:MAG: hypothetical protein U0175_12315 [Caldilineaceae bacterium]
MAAKALLFRKLYDPADRPGYYHKTDFWQTRCAVLNADDEGSYGALRAVLDEETAAHGYRVPERTYAIHAQADVIATEISFTCCGTNQFCGTLVGRRIRSHQPLDWRIQRL